jgi:alpha-1,3-rhamnosyl/mannosyltransferase
MRIALDGTPLSIATGGIARYTWELSRSLAEEFADDEYSLLSDQPFQVPAILPANLRQQRPASGGSIFSRKWWSFGLAKELARMDADIFHGTDFAVPYVPARPSVLTVHDLSPWRDPRWHSGADRIRRRTPLLVRLGIAGLIITPSESVRREAIEMFQLCPGRVVTTPLAAGEQFRPTATSPRVRPYFLYTGTLEPRKNIPMLVEAWREVRRHYPVDLVLAGRQREDAPRVQPEPGLELLGVVAEEDLPALYSNALAFLYPSQYEGFGLPVLEAMACGTAALISRDPALAEVAGDAAMKIDAGKAKDWAAAMMVALTQPVWLAGMREKAIRRARDFSWAITARRTREVYEESARRFGS